jgi:hypothetical protein
LSGGTWAAGSGGSGSSAGTASTGATGSPGASGGTATAIETLPRVRDVASPEERSRMVTSRALAATSRAVR